MVQSTQIDFPVDNRDLVIVDDVLYTGRTIRAAMNGLFDLGRPRRRIQLCVLKSTAGHRELPVEAVLRRPAPMETSGNVKSWMFACKDRLAKNASCW